MTTVTVVVASTEAALLLENKGLSMRPVVAGFVLGIGLFSIEAVNENVATKLGTLILITALLVNGLPLLKLLGAAPQSTKN